MQKILVTRFGALGDLCICGWFLTALSRARPDSRITLVTKSRFSDLASRFGGVDRVLAPADGSLGALRSLAADLRRDRFDLVLDAHAVLRSRLLLLLAGRSADSRLGKDTAARFRLLVGRRLGRDWTAPALQRSLLERCLDLASDLPAVDAGDPAARPLGALRSPRGKGPRRIALAPGARWPSKRWPVERFARVAEGLLADTDHALDILLGPDEAAWYPGSDLALRTAGSSRVRLAEALPLPEVAARLADCDVLLTNDSGLLHLAEATGTPSVALFGPTVRAFGYFPQLPASRVLQVDLDCRPCSRTGRRRCRRGDNACLERIPAERALEAIASILEDG